MSMRRRLGVLSCVLVLLGSVPACGEDAPSGSPTDQPTDQPTGGVVTILSGTAAGGEPGAAVRLDRAPSLDAFAGQFRRGELGRDIRSTVAGLRLRDGQAPWGQVLAVGCDVPTTATVTVTDGVPTATPDPVPSPLRECFAPVTSVAILVVG